MALTITLIEAVGAFGISWTIVDLVTLALRGRRGCRCDGDQDDPDTDGVVWAALEIERYEAIVDELHDMPERWPGWVRDRHRAIASDLLAGSVVKGCTAQMLWESGNELRGLIAATDAGEMQDRGLRMLDEAGAR